MTVMIVDMINRFINYMSLHMPRFDIETGNMAKISDAVSAVSTFVIDVNFIIPLGDIVAIITICLAAEVAKFTAFAVNWVIRRVCDLIP